MKIKTLAIAAATLLLSAGIAAAATVTNDLNMRSGPGTSYGVIDTIPAGAYVNVLDCGGGWCRVAWQGAVGYASASYLAGGPGYAGPPVYAGAPVYVAPPPPVVFGFGWGGPRWYGHRGWGGHRGRWHGGGGWHHRHH